MPANLSALRHTFGFSRWSAPGASPRLTAMLMLGFVQELLMALAGLGFVSLVLAVFVVVARFLARRILGDDDGSSLR